MKLQNIDTVETGNTSQTTFDLGKHFFTNVAEVETGNTSQTTFDLGKHFFTNVAEVETSHAYGFLETEAPIYIEQYKTFNQGEVYKTEIVETENLRVSIFDNENINISTYDDFGNSFDLSIKGGEVENIAMEFNVRDFLSGKVDISTRAISKEEYYLKTEDTSVEVEVIDNIDNEANDSIYIGEAEIIDDNEAIGWNQEFVEITTGTIGGTDFTIADFAEGTDFLSIFLENGTNFHMELYPTVIHLECDPLTESLNICGVSNGNENEGGETPNETLSLV